MKRSLLSCCLPFFLAPVLAGCGSCNYTDYLSDVRSDLFLAETEYFSVSLACLSRETPFLTDGVACSRSDTVEITLTPLSDLPEGNVCAVRVLGEEPYGGEMSFQSVTGDFLYTQSCSSFPQKSVSLEIEWGENTLSITATSVKNDSTLTVEQALGKAVEAERERVDALTDKNVFSGEFHVRLLRRDKNYYYVGIVDTRDNTTALLLDADTGAVLARRSTP